MTGVFACQIMPRKERCVASPWVGSHGYSPAPIAADSALPPCTASSSLRYAARGISRFMPTSELCRAVLKAIRRLRALAARRADIGPVPFGIVWLVIAPQGRRADDRSGESGLVCHARTA